MDIETTDRSIKFYFDPISPYAWLATTQLDKLKQETGVEIILKPILFAGLLKAHGHKGPAEIPAKRDYTFRDVMRRAANYNLKFEGPPNHPFNPLLALRVCTAIEDNDARLKFACSLVDAAWREGLDITQSKTISEIAKICDLDPEWAMSCAQEPLIEKKLIDATERAVSLGVFGVPTFRVDDQIFWGDDRIQDLIRFLNGNNIDESKLKDVLSRESTVKDRP